MGFEETFVRSICAHGQLEGACIRRLELPVEHSSGLLRSDTAVRKRENICAAIPAIFYLMGVSAVGLSHCVFCVSLCQ
jgi:hypothetical protein